VPLLAATNLVYSVGHRVLLDEASLSIEAGERVGLVGRNGTGKSTLMRILSGVMTADAGQVSLKRGRRAGYLRQEPEFSGGETLRGEAEAAFAELHALHRRLDEIYEALAQPENAGSEATQRWLAEQARVERAMEAAGGYDVGHRIDETLHGLGLTDAEFNVPVEGLSGGQRARLALAKLLLESPDLLLLD
jgi:ATP-binding cassette subfamily F protein 3